MCPKIHGHWQMSLNFLDPVAVLFTASQCSLKILAVGGRDYHDTTDAQDIFEKRTLQ